MKIRLYISLLVCFLATVLMLSSCGKTPETSVSSAVSDVLSSEVEVIPSPSSEEADVDPESSTASSELNSSVEAGVPDGKFIYTNEQHRFSLTLPEELEEKLIFEELDSGVTVNHKASYEEMAYDIEGEIHHGGRVFTIFVADTERELLENFAHAPSFFIIDTESSDKAFSFMLPTDVQFTPETQEDYLEISNAIIGGSITSRIIKDGVFSVL